MSARAWLEEQLLRGTNASLRQTPAAWVTLRLVGVLLASLLAEGLVGLLLVLARTLLLPSAQGGPLVLAAESLVFLGGIGGVIWFARRDGWSLVGLGLDRRDAVSGWLAGALLGALLMAIVVFAWYTGLDGASWSTNPDLGGAAAALAAALWLFFLQGPSEEILFRGYVLRTITARWGLGWGVGVSAVLFGLLHAANPSFAPLPLVNLVLFGVVTALYVTVVDHGRLWGVCGLHTAWNWLQEYVFGLPNSGTTAASGETWFHVSPHLALPAWIGGGGFGPEGTLATTILLVVVAGALLVWARRPRPA